MSIILYEDDIDSLNDELVFNKDFEQSGNEIETRV